MATFPAGLEPVIETIVEPNSGLVIDQADDGSLKSRLMASESIYRITVVYRWLTEAESLQLENFYAANKLIINDIELKGYLYSVLFESEPEPQFEPGNRTTYRVRVIGTRSLIV